MLPNTHCSSYWFARISRYGCSSFAQGGRPSGRPPSLLKVINGLVLRGGQCDDRYGFPLEKAILKGTALSDILVDADACPVKDEIYRVAARYGLRVTLVANTAMYVPQRPQVELVVVNDHFDAADDWIVEHVRAGAIVVTGDIPLAARCLKKGARVLGLKGVMFTEESIGAALATREFLSQMREHGVMGGGPAPFAPKDRSLFLQRLDQLAGACRREMDAGG